MIDSLIVQLNSECNLNCAYCYSKKKFILNKDNIKKSMKEILRRYGIKHITITGGEPLLEYRFMIEILNEVRDKNADKTVITNGLLLNKPIISGLKKIDVNIRISIDGFGADEKAPSRRLVNLIKENKDYLKFVSKVITKENMHSLYPDFLRLVKLGFRDIDLIPRMYVYWSKKERDFMIEGLRKIVIYCLDNGIDTNLLQINGKNRYYDCNKIRILPDGDTSLCNSLNSVKKAVFLKNGRIDKFEKFKKKVVSFSLEKYSQKSWFKKEYLDKFCMVDAFYHSYINNKSDGWIISAADLFSRLDDAVKSELAKRRAAV